MLYILFCIPLFHFSVISVYYLGDAATYVSHSAKVSESREGDDRDGPHFTAAQLDI